MSTEDKNIKTEMMTDPRDKSKPVVDKVIKFKNQYKTKDPSGLDGLDDYLKSKETKKEKLFNSVKKSMSEGIKPYLSGGHSDGWTLMDKDGKEVKTYHWKDYREDPIKDKRAAAYNDAKRHLSKLLAQRKLSEGSKLEVNSKESTMKSAEKDSSENGGTPEEVKKTKHRVAVQVSDPNHPSVSKRTETEQRYVRVMAASKEEAEKAARGFYKKQGYKVHTTEYHSAINESEEQIDEISKKTLGSYVKKASLDAISQGISAGAMAQKGDGEKFNKSYDKAVNRLRGINKASDRLTKEDVELHEEEHPELKKIRDEYESREGKGTFDKKPHEYSDDHRAWKIGTELHNRYRATKANLVKSGEIKESIEVVTEKFAADATAGDYVKDFIKSDAPQFVGKSKAMRMKMALAAYYAAQKKNESVETEDSEQLDESTEALKKKASESGVSLGVLKKVHARGVAAWNSGHRPGTTPQQWGMARVNSYITKGKTYHTADKDLHEGGDAGAFDVNEIDEACWDGWKQQGMKKKGDKMVPNCIKESEELDEFIISSNTKGHILNVASEVSDVPGNWDHKNQKFTANGEKELHSRLNGNQKHINYAKMLTAKHYESIQESVKDDSRMNNDAYHKGLAKSTALARVKHWKNKDKLSDSNPAAYEPAPGDKTAETKPSKYTLLYKKLFSKD